MAENTATALQRRSPLARYGKDGEAATIREPGVTVQELPFQGVLRLQAGANASAFADAVRNVLGIELPLVPNTRLGDNPACLWVAPGEWLLLTPPEEDEDYAQRLKAGLEQMSYQPSYAMTVITDARVVFRVEGTSAAALLNKGCSLDLNPSVFDTGSAAGTRLEQVGMTLYSEVAGHTYVAIVDRSYAAFAFEWLTHSATEFRHVE